MKKVLIMLLVLLCVMPICASRKGKRVLVRRSASCAFANVTQRRAPAKELVSLYQEDGILHVNVEIEMLVTVTLKDEEGNTLSQVMLTSQESDVDVPTGAALVEVDYKEVNLVGLLY